MLIIFTLDVDNVLQRMSIVGVILCFRASCQEALNEVLCERIPFLLSSVNDFKHNMPVSENLVIIDFFVTYFDFSS